MKNVKTSTIYLKQYPFTRSPEFLRIGFKIGIFSAIAGFALAVYAGCSVDTEEISKRGEKIVVPCKTTPAKKQP